MNSAIISPTRDAALIEADRCVKCGLCLPHCPTYRLYADENESPRGRIALAEALLQGVVQPDAAAQKHMDRCLLCQRCEKVCPSQVGYSVIMDAVRQQWPRLRWSGRLAQRPRLFSALYRLAQALPQSRLLPANIRLAQALGYAQPAPKPSVYPPKGAIRGRIGLLLGCATRAAQGNALHASIQLLNALGYAVSIPAGQTCCGALAAHQGENASAAQMAETNRQAFDDNLDQVLTIASGCAAYSQQHPFAQWPVNDMLIFLAQTENLHRLDFKPFKRRVAVYQPCSLVNSLDAAQTQMTVLNQIPEIELLELGTPGDCCGAAGNHMLTERQQAEALRQPLLDALRTMQPDYLVTNNIGCALHLAEGIRQSGLAIQTMHPVELLQKQR